MIQSEHGKHLIYLRISNHMIGGSIYVHTKHGFHGWNGACKIIWDDLCANEPQTSVLVGNTVIAACWQGCPTFSVPSLSERRVSYGAALLCAHTVWSHTANHRT